MNANANRAQGQISRSEIAGGWTASGRAGIDRLVSDIEDLLGDCASPLGVSANLSSWLPGPLRPGHSGATAPDLNRLSRGFALVRASVTAREELRGPGGARHRRRRAPRDQHELEMS